MIKKVRFSTSRLRKKWNNTREKLNTNNEPTGIFSIKKRKYNDVIDSKFFLSCHSCVCVY